MLWEHPSVMWSSFPQCPTPGKEERDLPGRGGEAGPLCRADSPGRDPASLRSASQEEELVVGSGCSAPAFFPELVGIGKEWPSICINN